MTHAHGAVLISIVRAEPYLYLKEIAQAMTERTGVEYSAGRCYYELKVRGYSLKKMRKKARQRDEQKRDAYWETITELLIAGAGTRLCWRSARAARFLTGSGTSTGYRCASACGTGEREPLS